MDTKSNNHFAGAIMMIRKPVAEVYNAFINPEITTQFWFSEGSAALSQGSTVEWTWKVLNHKVKIRVLSLIPNESILIQWGSDPDAQVRWSFEATTKSKTLVSIRNTGFKGNQDELISQIRDSTEGFTLVLTGLKALLEHGVVLNLVADKYEDFDDSL